MPETKDVLDDIQDELEHNEMGLSEDAYNLLMRAMNEICHLRNLVEERTPYDVKLYGG